MKKQTKAAVMGQIAPSPRVTKTAACLIAVGLSIPVFLLLTLIDVLFL